LAEMDSIMHRRIQLLLKELYHLSAALDSKTLARNEPWTTRDDSLLICQKPFMEN
jgi:hypothetical protein